MAGCGSKEVGCQAVVPLNAHEVKESHSINIIKRLVCWVVIKECEVSACRRRGVGQLGARRDENSTVEEYANRALIKVSTAVLI